MTRVLVGDKELEAQEKTDDVWTRISSSGNGVRHAGMRITPPGWISLSSTELGDLIVQVSSIGYVRP